MPSTGLERTHELLVSQIDPTEHEAQAGNTPMRTGHHERTVTIVISCVLGN